MDRNLNLTRRGRLHRRPELEVLELRQLLSLSSSSSSFVRPDGTVAFDQVIQASSARATYGVDGTGENVAVIDTGVDFNNPAFGTDTVGSPGNKVVAGVDFTGSPDGVLPTWQHGTGVAGLIASTAPANPGVAPGAGIVALRVFGDTNAGSFASIAKALDWVVQNHTQYHITAVNLSVSDNGNYTANLFATDGSDGQSITTSVATLDGLNIPVVVAAGNAFDGKTQGEGFASIIPDTISVTATDETKLTAKGGDPLAADAQRLGSAQGGTSATDIAAPGVNLVAPSGDSGTATEEGTSFATPQVSGTILLLQQMYQRAYGTLPSVTQLDGWLQGGADMIHDSVTGIDIGRLDVAGSLMLLNSQIQATKAAPTITTTAPAVLASSAGVALASSTTTTVAQPVTALFVNGSSVGSLAPSPLATTDPRLATLIKPQAKNHRASTPTGSSVNLGALKPSGSVLHPKRVAIPTHSPKIKATHHVSPPSRSAGHPAKASRALVAAG